MPGFLTDDINYIWCNNNPTIFNTSDYNLTPDHELSLHQMEQQSHPDYEVRYADNELLMLNQYPIHKVAAIVTPGMRCFLKISFSAEKYNLIGNSHNHLLKYNWDMKPRQTERNHPISR